MSIDINLEFKDESSSELLTSEQQKEIDLSTHTAKEAKLNKELSAKH